MGTRKVIPLLLLVGLLSACGKSTPTSTPSGCKVGQQVQLSNTAGAVSPKVLQSLTDDQKAADAVLDHKGAFIMGGAEGRIIKIDNDAVLVHISSDPQFAENYGKDYWVNPVSVSCD